MNRKLTDQQVVDLRYLRERGIGINTLSRRFGISRPCVRDIVEGRTYADVSPADPSVDSLLVRDQWQRRDVEARNIRRLWSYGFTARQIRDALDLSMTVDAVYKVAKGLRR